MFTKQFYWYSLINDSKYNIHVLSIEEHTLGFFSLYNIFLKY